MQNPVENKASLGILCSYIIKSVVLLARSYLSMQLGFVQMQSGPDRTKKRAQEAPSPRRKIVTLLFTLHPSFINERFPCSGSSTRLFFHPLPLIPVPYYFRGVRRAQGSVRSHSMQMYEDFFSLDSTLFLRVFKPHCQVPSSASQKRFVLSLSREG